MHRYRQLCSYVRASLHGLKLNHSSIYRPFELYGIYPFVYGHLKASTRMKYISPTIFGLIGALFFYLLFHSTADPRTKGGRIWDEFTIHCVLHFSLRCSSIRLQSLQTSLIYFRWIPQAALRNQAKILLWPKSALFRGLIKAKLWKNYIV